MTGDSIVWDKDVYSHGSGVILECRFAKISNRRLMITMFHEVCQGFDV